MRQLIVTHDRAVEWQEVPAPSLSSPQAALVRPIAVATCDFDHQVVAGRAALPLPLAIGHEFVADVVEVGKGVSHVKVGDRVVVPFQINCGKCGACLRGQTSSCETQPFLSCYGLGDFAGGFGGAMSDLVNVPYADAMLVPLPQGVSPAEAAACSCNVTDAYRCVGPQLQERPGVSVLIASGAFGNIALYAAAIALAMGAERVDFVDSDPRRAALASKIGAHVISANSVKEGAYPITVDASMDTGLLATVIRATAPSGECTVSTMYATAETPIPLFAMFQNCVTLRTGQPHIRAHLEAVLKLVATGVLKLGPLTDAIVGWEEAPAVFASGHGKTVCTR